MIIWDERLLENRDGFCRERGRFCRAVAPRDRAAPAPSGGTVVEGMVVPGVAGAAGGAAGTGFGGDVLGGAGLCASLASSGVEAVTGSAANPRTELRARLAATINRIDLAVTSESPARGRYSGFQEQSA
jgi:hypothetical protein